MTNNLHFHLPDWPPQRLAREAVCAWGLRHLSEPEVDVATTPWPQVRLMICAFLRHQISQFDERLRARAEYDKEFRDALAAQITTAAYRKYPWLGEDDPRPFPESEDEVLPFDELSKELADLHTLRDHLVSAISDLKRQGNHGDDIAYLQTELLKTQREIDWCYTFLSGPKIIPEEGKTRLFVRAYARKEGVEPAYHFYSGKKVSPNRIEYLGFRCPRCRASVARWKQIIPLGQGYRCVIIACHCLTTAAYTPGGHGRIAPVTMEDWAGYCQQSEDNAKCDDDQ